MKILFVAVFLPGLWIPCYLHGQELVRHSIEHAQMGTQFQIIFYTSGQDNTAELTKMVIQQINKLNEIFSDYQSGSELSRLSATAGTGQKVRVSKALWRVIKKAERFSKLSNGAFDISIGPLSKLWRSMFRKQRLFEKDKINKAKEKVNFRNIKRYPFGRKIKLVRPNMRLDLGGIAKGYTVDQLAKTLKQSGVNRFLVDGGGDIYVGQAPPEKKGWHIKIKAENAPDYLLLSNRAIAVSGDTYRFLEWNHIRYSHIIDPRTGYGVRHQKRIHVLAKDCTTADALASTLSVLNEKESNAFLKKIKKVQVF